MDNPNAGFIMLFFIIAIIVIFTIMIIIIASTKNSKEIVLYTIDPPEIDENELEDYKFPLTLNESTIRMAILIIPATQPPLNAEARKHIGFHITGFPSQPMPADYNLVEVMKGFNTSDTNWNLKRPGIKTAVKQAKSKNLVLMMIYNANTINKLRDYLMTKGWSNPWKTTHVTLGYIDPPDAADPQFFIDQPYWSVQLVINSGPVAGRGWPKNQRVLLKVASRENN
jgi:hypothetical protein